MTENILTTARRMTEAEAARALGTGGWGLFRRVGLPLARRQRHYGSAHPREARAIFIEEALVGGRLLKKPRVLLQNLARIEAVREKEARLRRPDLLVTDAQLFARYDERLPEDVCTDAALRRWLQMGGAARLALSEDDLLRRRMPLRLIVG